MCRSTKCIHLFLLAAYVSICFCCAPLHAVDVYVFSAGDSNINNAVQSTLQRSGHNVRIGVECTDFAEARTIEGYDCVLFLNSANAWSGWQWDMPGTGQTALQNFVNAGGGLVTGEWVVLKTASRHFVILASMLPATSDTAGFFAVSGRKSPITYAVAEPNSVLNRNVTSPFTFQADSIVNGTETKLVPKPEAHVFYDSDGLGVGVVGWNYGAGRVLSFSTVIGISELSDPDYSQLLSNALIWASKGTAPVPPAPEADWPFEGTWAVKASSSSGSLVGMLTVNAPHCIDGRYMLVFRHATADPTIEGWFPEASACTDFCGNAVRIRENVYQGTSLAYGTEKAEGSAVPRMAWMSLMTAEFTVVDPNTARIIGRQSVFLPEQDIDDDGLPDDDQEPAGCLAYVGTATRVPVRIACTPPVQ